MEVLVQTRDYRAACAGSLVADVQPTQKMFVQLYESIHLYTTDSHEARSFTRPETDI